MNVLSTNYGSYIIVCGGNCVILNRQSNVKARTGLVLLSHHE